MQYLLEDKRECRICGSHNIAQDFSLKEFDVLRCRNCTTSFISRIPRDDEFAELYSSDYYMERFEYYYNNFLIDPEHGKRNGNMRSFADMLDALKLMKPKSGRILDVGCGLGIFLRMSKDYGWQGCGIDASPYAVHYAKEKFHLDVFQGTKLRDVSLPSSQFDVVTLWDTLEHFADPRDQLAEIRRVLKDDGLLILDTPNGEALMRLVAKVCYRLTDGLLRYPVAKLYHRFHLYYFTPKSLRVLLESSGFELLSLEHRLIPIVKARGNSMEKHMVQVLSNLEKKTHREFELVAMARKSNRTVKAGGKYD